MATERLQAAIAKARAAREEKTGQPHQPQARPAQKSATPPAPAGWDDIPRVSLDQSLLERNLILSVASGRQATPFDILRTRVLQRMRENGWKRLAVTSPGTGCGKSTMVLNLGFGMARQPDRRIVAIEADMRRPNQEKLLGVARKDRSVARFLEGLDPVDVSAVRARTNLAIMLNSQHAANASDVLLGDSVGPALAGLEDALAPDIMLFDMPPLLVNDDTMAFLGHVDCAMIVAGAGDTTMKDVDQTERLIAQETNVLGVVLNKCRYGESSDVYEYY